MFKKILDMQKELLSKEDLEDSPLEDKEEMNEEEVKAKLPTYSSEKLSDFVISYRYLGLYKDLSTSAMEELSKRRVAGDQFKYEEYIETNLKELPELNFEVKNINSLFAGLKGMKYGR